MDKQSSYIVGQIVFSKAGKDKGQPYLIAHVDDTSLWLIDGKLRVLAKPKHKKMIHVSKTNHVTALGEKLQVVYNPSFDQAQANKLMLKDSDIRAEIKQCLLPESKPL